MRWSDRLGCAYSPAGAQEQPTYERFAEDAAATNTVVLDNIFIFVAAVLVFLMQPGFAVEAGLTRAKNAANIMMKNLMDVAIGVLVFAAIGWGIAYRGRLLDRQHLRIRRIRDSRIDGPGTG